MTQTQLQLVFQESWQILDEYNKNVQTIRLRMMVTFLPSSAQAPANQAGLRLALISGLAGQPATRKSIIE